ncbi:hypothetical protein JKF63_01429 [Porcisia hertigi]|uniref:Uncharacterized protein n=1 Tax=Porcisia hertigi TaxID=2761500 RepID=A0A836HJR1_9TRYP|nr:hypothetical protein JKF63_01429 [Porcisia hertigi]
MKNTRLSGSSSQFILGFSDFHNGFLEIILLYGWVILVGSLVLAALAKHSLMCWELRQDRRRLESCNSRHCKLRLSACNSKSIREPAIGTQSGAATSTTNTKPTVYSPFSKDPYEAGETAKDSGRCTGKREREDQASHPMGLFKRNPLDGEVPLKETNPTANAALRCRRENQLGSTLVVDESDNQSTSLLIESASTTTSDCSLMMLSPSTASTITSTTTRLLSRLNLMSADTNQINDDCLGVGQLSNSSSVSSRLSNCCPHYSKDVQRLIDQKRQENVREWMEAKRALESTESLAMSSSGCMQLSSLTRLDIST